MEWLPRGVNRPQTVSRERSTAKIMFLPFFDCRGLLHAEFIQNATVTSNIFRDVLTRMRTSMRVRRDAAVWAQRYLYKLHMDNASAHRGKPAQDALNDMNFNQLKHPPYSPDLSPCDFFCFLS